MLLLRHRAGLYCIVTGWHGTDGRHVGCVQMRGMTDQWQEQSRAKRMASRKLALLFRISLVRKVNTFGDQ